MTTIVYKAGVIAYDSRSTCGGTIVDDDANKHSIKDGVHFFFCGVTAEKENMSNAYFDPKSEGDYEGSAIVFDHGELFCYGLTKDDGYWKHPISANKVYAIGSGRDHAYTAMDMGADAKTAVKMAIKRDSGSGGKIRTFKTD